MKKENDNPIGPGGELIYYEDEKKPLNDMDIIKLHGLKLRRGSKRNVSSRKTKREQARLLKRLSKRRP